MTWNNIKSGIQKGYTANILLLALLLFYAFLLFPEEYVTYKILIWLTTYVIALCLFKISKVLFRLFMISLGLLAAFYYPINNLFGPITTSNVEALMATNYAEVTSYLSVVPTNLYVESILLFLFPVFLGFLMFRSFTVKTSWILIFVIAGLYLSNRYFTEKIYTKTFEGAFNTIPTKLMGNIAKFFSVGLKGMKYQAKLMTQKDDWQIESAKMDKELYFFIIGESVRKDVFSNLKLFNAHPLDSIPKIQFENAISHGFITIPALRSALVLRKNNETDEEAYFPDNIVNLAKKAGIHTEWYSNQGFVGADDDYISAIAKCADYSEFLNKKQYFDYRKSDEDLVKILQQRLGQSTSGHNIYFLHTIGSHPAACKITDGKYDKFIISDEVSCYIKSIENTKNLIYEVYKIAKNSGKTFKVVYFSDHGITFNYQNKIFTHRKESKEEYTVPFLVLADDISGNVVINAKRNLGDFINFFQELTGIRAKGVNYDYRFISEDYEKNWHQLSDGMHFNQLEENPIPFK
jgi:glucan phosphoethanolaminetransferase (alkaline phosphatase superfamily)